MHRDRRLGAGRTARTARPAAPRRRRGLFTAALLPALWVGGDSPAADAGRADLVAALERQCRAAAAETAILPQTVVADTCRCIADTHGRVLGEPQLAYLLEIYRRPGRQPASLTEEQEAILSFDFDVAEDCARRAGWAADGGGTGD